MNQPFKSEPRAAVMEAAPAQTGVRWLAMAMVAVFAVLGARAAFVTFTTTAPTRAVQAEAPANVRANIVDRNGELLATSLPAFNLLAETRWVSDPQRTARALAGVLPGLSIEDVTASLRSGRNTVQIARAVTPPQRAAVHALGLAGLVFEPTTRRFYPNLETMGRVIGRVNAEGVAIAGLEQGLNGAIQDASAAGRAVAVSLDLRVQHAAEAELARALQLYGAKAGAAVVLNGETGETLALASAPLVNPNTPLASGAPPADLVTGAAYELGSTLKPFTAASALDLGLATLTERFDTRAPLVTPQRTFRDPHPLDQPATLEEALAKSSNVTFGALALRMGAVRQREAFERLGLAAPAPLAVGGAQAFVLPRETNEAATAANGFGRGPLFTVMALASAYTVFVNDGERVSPTLAVVRDGDPTARQRVYSAQTAQTVLGMLRRAVEDGTGARAAAPGLDIAGKTGTAEKLGADGRYDPERNIALFAAVFPAYAPRYVMVVALDEPQRTPASGNLATGGATAAPTAGRIAARIAPFLQIEAGRIAVDLAHSRPVEGQR